MNRLSRQGQQISPAPPGCDQGCYILARQAGSAGYWVYYYYCGPPCFAPRRSRQK